MVEKEEKIIRPAKMRNRDSFERTIFEKKILFHPRENPRYEGKPPRNWNNEKKGDFSNWSKRRFKGLILSATLRCIRNLNYRFKLVRHSSLLYFIYKFTLMRAIQISRSDRKSWHLFIHGYIFYIILFRSLY